MKSNNPKFSVNFFCFIIMQLMGLGFIFSKSSQAQTAVFNFQTTIGGVCSFSNIQGGSLQLTPDRREFISNIPATATLTCNNTALTITLNPPEVASISAPFSIASSTATAVYIEDGPGNSPDRTITLTATNGSPDSKSYQGNGNIKRIAGSRTVTVNMSARSNTEVTAGLYRFMVRFSAIPQ